MTRVTNPAPSPLLAVVILSVGAPPELSRAVRSVLDQGEPVELVIVNSGGGDVAGRLPAGRRDIAVLSVDETLWPGAARNRGIAATTAPFIAFLASDCIAEPGWVAERLRLHLRGAGAVASAVVNGQPHNPSARLAHHLTYGRRDPAVDPGRAVRYGASYARWLFETYGLFREDLRLGEDTEFRLRLRPVDLPVWAPGVRVAHRNAASFAALLLDRARRGYLQAKHWPELRQAGLGGRLTAGARAAQADVASLGEPPLPRLRLWAALLAYELGHRVGRLRQRRGIRRDVRALTWLSRERWKDASRSLNSAVKGLADADLALYALIARSHRRDLEPARKLAEAAATKWPDDRRFSIRRAWLAPPGDPGAALALWDAHLVRFGASYAALEGRLAALVAARRLDEARAAADALAQAYPHATAAAWAVVEMALATHDWAAVPPLLQSIFERSGDPAALERQVTLLIALGRIADAQSAAEKLESLDLDSYLRAARELARTNNTPEVLVDLTTRHAGRIGANPPLLRFFVSALISVGADGAAWSLLDASSLGEATLRPLRVLVLLSQRRLAEAWSTYGAAASPATPSDSSIFSALVSAGLVAGDRQGVAELFDRADKSRNPALRVRAVAHRGCLADLAALGDRPPHLLARPPLELPAGLPASESLRLFDRIRRTHPKFHADPTLVLDDAIEVAAAVAMAADRREPLSLVRLGDGEGNLLPYAEPLEAFSGLDRLATATAWWGPQGRTIDTGPIGNLLESAIRDADIVGIPDLHRLMSLEKPGLEQSLEPAAKNSRGLHAVLDFVAAHVPPDRFITSCHVHQSLSTWGLWDLLLPRLAPMAVITCHEQLAPALAHRFGAEVSDVFLIPPERKHASRFASQVAGRHYPDRFEALRTELKGIQRGQVVLVAAGVLGKVYCQWIKAAGGIALDVGSAADAWVGYYTRSAGENATYAVLPGALEGLRALARTEPRLATIVG